MRLAIALLAHAIFLLDCGGPPPEMDAGPPVEAMLEVGGGEGLFAPVMDGDTMSLVSGCQGSQHVWVALRAWGIERRGTIIDLELVRDRDELVVSQTFRVRISFQPVDGEDYMDLAGLTLIVEDPDLALEEDLTLRATVTDTNGVEVVDERSVHIAWDPEGGCG